MKISAPRSNSRQLEIFERGDAPLGNHGHIRGLLGGFAEELTAEIFRGRRYKTDSTCDYCPDVVSGSVYFECKACGKSNQTFIYSGRLDKDRAFAADHWLGYAVWSHGVETNRAATAGELRSLFLKQLRGLYVVPFEAIDAICSSKPAEKLNSKYGHSNEPGTLYGSGYRVNLKELQPWLFLSWECE